jgi:hypothetical protein
MLFSVLASWLLCSLLAVSAQDTSLGEVVRAFNNASVCFVLSNSSGLLSDRIHRFLLTLSYLSIPRFSLRSLYLSHQAVASPFTLESMSPGMVRDLSSVAYTSISEFGSRDGRSPDLRHPWHRQPTPKVCRCDCRPGRTYSAGSNVGTDQTFPRRQFRRQAGPRDARTH